MKNIGVVLPYKRVKGNSAKNIIRHFFCEVYSVKEYGFDFIVVYDNQNCSRFFKRYGVKDVVILTDLEIDCCSYNIIDGKKIFESMITEFVRKKSKSYYGNCSVTVVDKKMSDFGMELVGKLCGFCSTVFVNTQNQIRGEFLCNNLLENYGVIASLIVDKTVLNTDFVVVLEDCGNKCNGDSMVIEHNPKNKNMSVVNDFYIPFRIKPPFGMSNVMFAECLQTIKDVDIQ